MTIGPYSVQIGPLAIHYYALILMAGMLTAAWITARRAKEQGRDPKYVWDGLLWAIIPAIIGARIYHILTPSPSAMAADGTPLTTMYYLQHPLEMLAIWNGGLGIYGGVVGGVLGAFYYLRHEHQPLLKWLDLAAPGLLLAQAIGRWGNFVNKELYGGPTTLPWGILIDDPSKRVAPYTNLAQYPLETTRFHPLFLYESLWNVAACGVMLLIERRFRQWLRDGDLALIYLIFYPTGRFLLDFIRLDSNSVGLITTAQLVSLLVAIVAAAILIIRHRMPVASKTPVVEAGT